MVNKQHQLLLLHDSFSMEIQEILTELRQFIIPSQTIIIDAVNVSYSSL